MKTSDIKVGELYDWRADAYNHEDGSRYDVNAVCVRVTEKGVAPREGARKDHLRCVVVAFGPDNTETKPEYSWAKTKLGDELLIRTATIFESWDAFQIKVAMHRDAIDKREAAASKVKSAFADRRLMAEIEPSRYDGDDSVIVTLPAEQAERLAKLLADDDWD